ncbi:MAG: complex I subunit 5 family protein [Christensenellales bacterium]
MNNLLLVLIGLPLLAAVPGWFLARRNLRSAYWLLIGVTLAEMGFSGWLLASGRALSYALPGLMGFHLQLRLDGFRALYAAVACLMWLMTSLLTPQYMAHGHKQGRYILFTLLTMGATVGVFLSDDLVTAFLFFEIMSFTSYCWVAHEETPGALRAAQTYLAIAIFGGMAMLMGLWLLEARIGTLRFDEMMQAAESVDRNSLYLPGALILTGFGAKAGMFPLHVWLPKAHPVAPAPASALLSGILTKVGIFGILVISTRLFFEDALWGQLLLCLGLINMFLGALLALFSVDLKRTLACSSMSQIGFILFGIGMQALLGEENALAAQGTVLHMLNHSLIKLVLFMAAGVVHMNLHQLKLNDIRGFGRRKFGLMLCFLVGAASLSGIPPFSGYASKTLLHESIIEYIHHIGAHGNALPYQLAEWVFIITGGLTFCYMLKLFVVIFIQKHPTRQKEFDKMGPAMNGLSGLALGGSALLLFVLGLAPEKLMAPLADLALPFLQAHPPEHAVHFLTAANLIGGAKSLAIGLALYFLVVRPWLTGKDKTGLRVYLDRWPEKLDLENAVYRPLVTGLTRLGTLVCIPFDIAVDLPVLRGMIAGGTFVARFFDSITDAFSLLLMRTVFRPHQEEHIAVPIGNRFTYRLGRLVDGLRAGIQRVLHPARPVVHKYVYVFAAAWENANVAVRKALRTMSFSLMLFAVGLVLILAYLLTR